MSIWASWPDIGEGNDFAPDNTVLSYGGSHVYPQPGVDKPGMVGISHIPGFIWRAGLPESRREQDDDDPVAPFLRLDMCEWSDEHGRPMNAGNLVLTRAAAERLRNDLSEWLDRPMHGV